MQSSKTKSMKKTQRPQAMGKSKGKRNKSAAHLSNISDADSITSTTTALSDLALAHESETVNSLDALIERCLDSLDRKSFSRLNALSELVDAFERNVHIPYIENKCITILDACITSLRKGKGSSTEACLASRAIGLLAATAGTGGTANKILEQSLPYLERALLTESDTLKKSVLYSLAITTFVGAINWEESEKSMKIMWDIIQPKSGTKVIKPSAAVLASALSAWSFLLTTIAGWRIDLETWTKPISCLCNLLEHDDRAVRVSAGEALAITFEIVIADKLSKHDDLDDSDPDCSKPKWPIHLMTLKAKIINQVTDLSREAGGKHTADKKNLKYQRDLFQKLYKYFVYRECPETLTNISKCHCFLLTSTWSELIQLNFFRHFLASGFLKHAQENDLFHDNFDLVLNIMDLSSKAKRGGRSLADKERTKIRRMAQQMKVGQLFTYD